MVNFNNKYKTMKHIKEYHEFINENLAYKLEDVLYKKFIDNKQHKQWFDDYDELEDPIFYTMGTGGRMAFDSVVAKDQAKFVKAVTDEVEKFNKINKTKFKVQPDVISESVNEATEQDYVVKFWTIQNDDDIDWDWDVKATSPEDAIAKVKSGKAKGPHGETVSRIARKFSAELKKK
jgi:hypothetical protein